MRVMKEVTQMSKLAIKDLSPPCKFALIESEARQLEHIHLHGLSEKHLCITIRTDLDAARSRPPCRALQSPSSVTWTTFSSLHPASPGFRPHFRLDEKRGEPLLIHSRTRDLMEQGAATLVFREVVTSLKRLTGSQFGVIWQEEFYLVQGNTRPDMSPHTISI